MHVTMQHDRKGRGLPHSPMKTGCVHAFTDTGESMPRGTGRVLTKRDSTDALAPRSDTATMLECPTTVIKGGPSCSAKRRA